MSERGSVTFPCKKELSSACSSLFSLGFKIDSVIKPKASVSTWCGEGNAIAHTAPMVAIAFMLGYYCNYPFSS